MEHAITGWLSHPSDEFAVVVTFADGAVAYGSEKAFIVVKDGIKVASTWKEGLTSPYAKANDGPPMEPGLMTAEHEVAWLRAMGRGVCLDLPDAYLSLDETHGYLVVDTTLND